MSTDGITDEDLYWAAGYFDARGVIYFYDTHVKVIIQDRHREVLSRFAWTMDLAEPGTKLVSGKMEVSARHVVRRLLTDLRPHLTGEELLAKIGRALEWIEMKDGALSRLQLFLL
jgi:hypothetical protein